MEADVDYLGNLTDLEWRLMRITLVRSMMGTELPED